jgi:pyruvate/2-oxoglutarate dehydrogenase complex dihydrolipoamide dehydrogenase (E3) component/uncharacterized membrane protein YdjX (TVP38/TMEM64 family)
MNKKLVLIVLVGLAVIAFFAFDLDEMLTLQALKAGQERFAGWQETSPWLVGLGFFALYVTLTSLSVPGAAVMTIAAGALFGLFWGTLIVSFASSIGATVAFLVARFLLRDSVQRRFGRRLKTIDEGIKRECALYLFTLRLVPVFPFFVINVLMGLTAIRVATFYGASQLGMLPATLVYVNAGTQLGQVETLSGILSPGILMSFALLGLFPLIAKRVLDAVKKRRVYAKWEKPKHFDRNLVVIGAGAAGLVTSYIAATVKARVTLIEGNKMGGDCLNYGCVPSKALIRSAKLAHQMRHADRYGLKPVEPAFSFRAVMARIHEIIRAVEPHDSVERYTKLGVEVLQGRARIVDPWTVEVTLSGGESQRITTRSIVIAAGAEPIVPSLPGIDEAGYVTTDTLWEEFAARDEVPRRLIVLGGGPVGCELAQSFARLGSHVTQVQKGPRLMPREDPEVAALVEATLAADGVEVLTKHKAERCEQEGQRKFLVVEHEGAERRIEFDELLCAVGRAARLRGYGLEELGIPGERTVETNEYLETIYPNILAAGDVAGPYQFTHAAGHQAWYAAVNALFGHVKKFKADYSVMPWTTFTDPEVAHVGVNEQEAKQQGIEYEVTRYDLAELDRAIADSAARGFVKVLTVPGKDRILGVTLVGEHAGELLAEFVLAMKQGSGLGKILGTIHTYPTFGEANKYAAGEWRRAHAPQRLLDWVGRYHAWRRG